MRPEQSPFIVAPSTQAAQRTQGPSRFATTQELDRVLDVISTITARLESEEGPRR
jgi:hypothetical protein